ncbi:PEP-utilizing enzyme [Mycolicibacterium sp. XJ1819]
MLRDTSARIDNLHVESGPTTLWSRVNAAEAQPGVCTPLSWDFWDDTAERAMRGSWYDLGVLRASEVAQPKSVDERVWAAFYGRVALNVDFIRKMADRTPGTSGEEIERDILGSVRPDAVSQPTRTRYPVMFAKAPLMLKRLPALIERNYLESHRWWQEHALGSEATDDLAEARALWADAVTRFEYVMRVHCRGSNMAQRAFGELAAVGAQAGLSGVETALSGGYTDTEDLAVMGKLWQVSRGQSTLDEFIASYGFHGPAEGQLAVPSWREDTKPLVTILDSYASMPDDRAPLAVAARRAEERVQAEASLLAALSPLGRRKARRAIRRLALGVKLRERGKATYPLAIDVARVAARAVGNILARRRLIDEPEDVFFLLRAEAMVDGPAVDLKELVALRRERFTQHRQIDLPDTWIGEPTPAVITEGSAGDDLHGLGVSPGRIQGTVRVIVDPDGESQLNPGEILVCHTSDPSWGALMLVASALVIDVGGPMSHGAIIARELGIPCVINTKHGTRTLRTGDTVVVDGDTGSVLRN